MEGLKQIEMKYAWSMPSRWTFTVPVIRRWLRRWCRDGKNWADPMSGRSRICQYQGDLSKGVDALDFFKQFKNESLDGVLFDPPYSVEQAGRSYKGMGIKNWQDGNKSGSFPLVRNEIKRCVKPDGFVLSFGWNSMGMGSFRGFDKIAILLVCHGAGRNDTICLAERKKIKPNRNLLLEEV